MRGGGLRHRISGVHALDLECARVNARVCDVITKGVQQAPPDQLRHHLRPRAPVRARNDLDPPGRVPTSCRAYIDFLLLFAYSFVMFIISSASS